MKSLTRTRTVGGSLVITKPAQIVKSEMLRENELVEVAGRKPKKEFFGTLRGIGSFTKEDELKGQLE